MKYLWIVMKTQREKKMRMTRARWWKCFFLSHCRRLASSFHHFFCCCFCYCRRLSNKEPKLFLNATVSLFFCFFFGCYLSNIVVKSVTKPKREKKNCHMCLGQCTIHTSTWLQSSKMLKAWMIIGRASLQFTLMLIKWKSELKMKKKKTERKKEIQKKNTPRYRICMTSLTHGIINTEVLFHVLDFVAQQQNNHRNIYIWNTTTEKKK